MRTLTNDPQGTALFLEREARGMHPLQVYRELVQNGFEAGATTLWLDGYRDQGRLLSRTSDDGHGFAPEDLVAKLSTLHGRFKGGDNFGLGARLAALPQNPAGVTYASRSALGAATVMLVKSGDSYGLQTWEIEAPGGGHQLVELVAPDHRELSTLDQLSRQATGTAVILRGDGHSDTWSTATADRVHQYLAERYFEFPPGVRVYTIAPRRKPRVVLPYRQLLDGHKVASGHVPFTGVYGLDGVIHWWLLPEPKPQRDGAKKVVPHAGIGVLTNREIFPHGTQYLEDFGLWLKPAKQRVALLVDIAGAEMDSARASVFFPSTQGERKNVPWKAIGRCFVDSMPEEIRAVASTRRAGVATIDEKVADELDPEWRKRLDPIQLRVPSRAGVPATGSGVGEAMPPATARVGRAAKAPISEAEEPNGAAGSPTEARPSPTRRAPRHRPAQRSSDGNQPAKWAARIVLPNVAFEPASLFDTEQHPLQITYITTDNTVAICEDFPPYVREVARWVEDTSLPRAAVDDAVRRAFVTEYAAFIIDANAQNKHHQTPAAIEDFKSDAALYAKALGRVSLPELIRRYIKEAKEEV